VCGLIGGGLTGRRDSVWLIGRVDDRMKWKAGRGSCMVANAVKSGTIHRRSGFLALFRAFNPTIYQGQ
jgi:hypothetical protein